MNSNKKSGFSILFFSTFDSMNYWIPPLVDDLIHKGYKYQIVTRDDSDFLNNKMFHCSNYNVLPASNTTPEIVDNYDFIVLPPIYVREFTAIIQRAIEKGKFTISTSYLFSSVVMRCYPDLILTLGKSKFQEFLDNELHYSSIAIGNPQYDKLICPPIEKKEIKDVLIIDQGGFPYGKTGKKQYADVLDHIATANPKMQFTLKPRYTLAEIGSGQTTHQLSESLSDYIDASIPNLKIIETPVILEDIIPNYDAMISTWSTAYYAAMMARIPQIIIEGFDSIDVFDVRSYRIAEAYSHLRNSGMVVHYKNVDFNNLQFRLPNEKFVIQEVYQSSSPCAGDMVALLEFLKVNLVNENLRIIYPFQETLSEFYKNYSSMKLVNSATEQYSYWNQLRFQLNLVMQEAVYQNRSMGNKLNLSTLQSYITTCQNNYNSMLPISHYVDQLEGLFLQAKENLFCSANIFSLMEDDSILQDFYLDWLYETNQFDVILKSKYPYTCTGSLNYYKALIMLPHHKIKAFRLLFLFLEELFNRDNVIVYLKERRLAQSMIPFFKGINKYFLFLFLFKTKKYVIFSYLNEGAVANSPIMSYYKLKYLVGSRQFQTAETVYRRFLHKTKDTKRYNILHKVISLLMRLEYKRIQDIK